MKLKKFFFVFLCGTISCYKAVVIKPVIDLLGDSVNEFKKYSVSYKNISYASLHTINACPRIYQLLFHEIVEVLEEKSDEVKISYTGCFFYKNNVPCCEFWTLKSNLLRLTKVLDQTKLPLPIDYEKHEIPCDPREVQLKEPFFDKKNHTVYSACTRFIKEREDEHDYHVFVINPTNNMFDIILIPKKKCFQSTHNKRNDFINILRAWTHRQGKNFIPYVLGGASFCYTRTLPFMKTPDQRIFYPHEKNTIKCGMDCSSLLVRAAQLAKIPYFCRNTATLQQYLPHVKEGELLENGDLIFFKGHIIIISDTINNLCIEARGYKNGFGKIQEIPLNKLFKGINTFGDLKKVYIDKKPLQRLDSDGNVCLLIDTFKLLKFPGLHNY